jgi:hypothetical protein
VSATAARTAATGLTTTSTATGFFPHHAVRFEGTPLREAAKTEGALKAAPYAAKVDGTGWTLLTLSHCLSNCVSLYDFFMCCV